MDLKLGSTVRAAVPGEKKRWSHGLIGPEAPRMDFSIIATTDLRVSARQRDWMEHKAVVDYDGDDEPGCGF